jgi:hypothetical protein
MKYNITDINIYTEEKKAFLTSCAITAPEEIFKQAKNKPIFNFTLLSSTGIYKSHLFSPSINILCIMMQTICLIVLETFLIYLESQNILCKGRNLK